MKDINQGTSDVVKTEDRDGTSNGKDAAVVEMKK